MDDGLVKKPTAAEKASFVDANDAVLKALASVRFGAIHLTVHEGKLVQMDVTERQRFSN